MRTRLFAGTLVMMLALQACSTEPKALTLTEGPLLTLTAHAKVERAPDIANIQIGVSTQSATAQAAMAENAKRMNGVIAALKAAGLTEKDIQTSGFSLSPRYQWRENQSPLIQGYDVANTVSARVRDLTKLGGVLDGVVRDGGNRVDSVSFALSDPEQALDEARGEAMKRAREKARIYAEGAGLSVKRIITIDEGVSASPLPEPMPMARKASFEDAAAATPMEAGEIEMTAHVTVRFELK